MDRRDFLKLSAITGAGFLFGDNILQPTKSKAATFSQELAIQAKENTAINCGWIRNLESRKHFIKSVPHPFLNEMDSDIRGTGAGKQAILWPFLEKVMGSPFKPHTQEIGDCVSHAYGLGVDVLTAVQIVKRDSPQRWVAESATEIIYAGGRIEIGRDMYNQRYGEGMDGYTAAGFLKKYGVLLRQKYLNWDFTQYSGRVARQLGNSGVPNELEPLCKLHPIGWAALVQSWEEARDCIFNGYPVILCSNQGFNTRRGRDKDGFLPPGGSWNHALLLAGIDEACNRPGGCIINSWGSDWVEGGTKLNQPLGSFWADAKVIDRMCKQGDTIALSSYAGYPRQNYDLW
jgi:hypothetical protein